MTTRTAAKDTETASKTRSSKSATKEKEEVKEKSQNVSEPLNNEAISGLSIYDALWLAQREMTNPDLDMENKFLTKQKGEPSKYPSLKSVMNVVRPACNQFGLFFTQSITTERINENITVEKLNTIVSKGTSSVVLSSMELPRYVDEKTRGGSITYFRRQEAMASFGLAGEEDTVEESESRDTVISPYYPRETFQDKEHNETREYEELVDLKDEITGKATTAKALGLKEEAYKEWFKAHVHGGWGGMTVQEAKAVLDYLKARIDDLNEVKKTVSPVTETIPY